MSRSTVFFTIASPSKEISKSPLFPSINYGKTSAQNRGEKYCSNIFGQVRRPAPTKACRGDSLWSPVSPKYDFDAVLSKEMPGSDIEDGHFSEEMPAIDTVVRHFSEEMPGSDIEDWHFSEEMPTIDTEVWHFSEEMPGSDTEVRHFSEEMPAIDTEDRHFSREMHIIDIKGIAVSHDAGLFWRRMKKRTPRITRINTNYFNFFFVFFVCFVDHFRRSTS
jgi:hypothetical protein